MDPIPNDGPHTELLEGRFRELLEYLPIFAWTCLPNGECNYLSPQWVSYTGIPASKQLGFAWLEQVHPHDRERARASWADAVQEQKAFDIEFRIRSGKGGYKWFESRARPLFDEAGVLQRWVGKNIDIHDLRVGQRQLMSLNAQLEETIADRTRELAERAYLLQQVQATAHVGSWILDVRTGRATWSDELLSMFSLVAPPESGSLAEVLGNESWNRLSKAIQECEDGNVSAELLLHLEDSRSLVHAFTCRVASLRSEGRVARVIVTLHDVTPQHLVQRSLEEQRATLDEFVCHAPTPIALFDHEQVCVKASDRWIRDFRLEGRDIIGVSLGEIFPGLTEQWRSRVKRVLQGSAEGVPEEEVACFTGQPEWMEWELRPLWSQNGVVSGLIFFARIFTQQKKLALALESQRRRLERSNQDLEQFAYAASHDLKEPLRAVAGCAQLLKAKYGASLDTKGRELADHVISGAKRMETLISDLLSYARVSSQQTHMEMVDLQRIVQLACSDLEQAIQERGAQVVVERLPVVWGNEGQLSLLFQNLISNALKYRSQDTPEIRVGVSDDGPRFRCWVRDNGIGIDPRHSRRIFEIFQRLHTREEYPGTGIGLAICCRIAAQHGGRMWVESSKGAGSTFFFSPWKAEPSHEPLTR